LAQCLQYSDAVFLPDAVPDGIGYDARTDRGQEKRRQGQLPIRGDCAGEHQRRHDGHRKTYLIEQYIDGYDG